MIVDATGIIELVKKMIDTESVKFKDNKSWTLELSSPEELPYVPARYRKEIYDYAESKKCKIIFKHFETHYDLNSKGELIKR